jgi:hypothetical protein
MKLLLETIGWWGSALILLAYALVSFSAVSAGSVWYQVLNGLGSIAVIIFSVYKRAYPTVILNIIWSAIAIISVIRFFQ